MVRKFILRRLNSYKRQTCGLKINGSADLLGRTIVLRVNQVVQTNSIWGIAHAGLPGKYVYDKRDQFLGKRNVYRKTFLFKIIITTYHTNEYIVFPTGLKRHDLIVSCVRRSRDLYPLRRMKGKQKTRHLFTYGSCDANFTARWWLVDGVNSWCSG